MNKNAQTPTHGNILKAGIDSADFTIDHDYLIFYLTSLLRFNTDLGDTSALNIYLDQNRIFIKGSVDSLWKKEYIQELVNPAVGINGIKSIENKLTVEPDSRYSDEKILQEIRKAMAQNIHIKSNSIQINVHKQSVTLEGEVRGWIEFKECCNSVFYTNGVIKIHNKLKLQNLSVIPEI